MSQRKLIRPDISEKRSSEPRVVTRRKLSPPEQTNAEEFYYLKQMSARTPMVIGFWRIGFKLVLSITLIPFIGIAGLALASSLSAWFRAALLWKRLSPELRPEGVRFATQAGRMLAMSVLGAVVVWGLSLLIPAQGSTAVRLAVVGALGALTLAIGAGGSWLLKVDVSQGVLRRLRKNR